MALKSDSSTKLTSAGKAIHVVEVCYLEPEEPPAAGKKKRKRRRGHVAESPGRTTDEERSETEQALP